MMQMSWSKSMEYISLSCPVPEMVLRMLMAMAAFSFLFVPGAAPAWLICMSPSENVFLMSTKLLSPHLEPDSRLPNIPIPTLPKSGEKVVAAQGLFMVQMRRLEV